MRTVRPQNVNQLSHETINFGPNDAFVMLHFHGDPRGSAGTTGVDIIVNPAFSAPELAKIFLQALASQIQAMEQQGARLWVPAPSRIPPANEENNGTSGNGEKV